MLSSVELKQNFPQTIDTNRHDADAYFRQQNSKARPKAHSKFVSKSIPRLELEQNYGDFTPV